MTNHINTNKIISLLFLIICSFSCKAQDVPQVNWEELQKTEPWKASEQWTPVPAPVTPGYLYAPPSDAIVLFNGKELASHAPPYADHF